MAPVHFYTTATLDAQFKMEENGFKRKEENIFKKIDNGKYKWEIKWINVVALSILHIISIYAFYLIIFQRKILLFVYCYIYGIFIAQGITAGAHRLWAHRSYKAKLPLKLLLLFMQTSSFQNSVYEWVRDHRVHHKFTDTDADPHNAKRGFFFSHMGWLLIRKHNDVKVKGKTVQMDDIQSDKFLMWQHRNYFPLMLICTFVIPSVSAWYIFDESFLNCFVIAGVLRYIFSVHSTWLVNSAAHIYGMKPYDRTIGPTENNWISFAAVGEGFHNYHHVFPWDYKTSELGGYELNWTLAFINFFAKIGWAYDLKTVSDEMVTRRALRTGDGTWKNSKNIINNSKVIEEENKEEIWGWGDPNMTEEDIKSANIINKKD